MQCMKRDIQRLNLEFACFMFYARGLHYPQVHLNKIIMTGGGQKVFP